MSPVKLVAEPRIELGTLAYETRELPFTTHSAIYPFCAPGGLRSHSPHIKNMVLSRLSYERRVLDSRRPYRAESPRSYIFSPSS